MSRIKIFLILFVGFAVTHSIAGAQTCDSIEGLKLLEGNWQDKDQNQTITETWRRVTETTFEGVGKTLDPEGNILSSESLRIVAMSGEIFYIAKVAQNEYPTSFKLTGCDQNNFEFENPEHDFPKKITYEFKSPDTLFVTVNDSNGNGFEINFSKQESE